MASQYPTVIEVKVTLIGETGHATINGFIFNQVIPTKEEVLRAVALAVVMTDSEGLPKLRIPTPAEHAAILLEDKEAGALVAPGPWAGFTQEELDAEVAEVRRLAEAGGGDEAEDDVEQN